MKTWNFKNLKGKKFGRLTVLSMMPKDMWKNGHSLWLCQCDCGKKKQVPSTMLYQGKTKSCGCLNLEKLRGKLGILHPLWKGGKIKNHQGYIMIINSTHPKAATNGGYVKEHILVMEKYIGRYLLPGETIHHKNGIRNDNHIKNLELRLRNHHPTGQSVEHDLIPYWIEMLKTYKPEILKQVD